MRKIMLLIVLLLLSITTYAQDKQLWTKMGSNANTLLSKNEGSISKSVSFKLNSSNLQEKLTTVKTDNDKITEVQIAIHTTGKPNRKTNP